MGLDENVINNLDNKFTEIISGLQEYLGEDIGIVTYSEVNCPNCFKSPISRRTAYYSPDDPWPSGSFPNGPIPFSGVICPYCEGEGDVQTEQIENIKCIVNWRRPSDWAYTQMGQVRRLTARIKTGINHWDSFKNAKVLCINDMNFEIKSLNKSGFKTLNNLICEAEIIGPSGV